MSGHAGSTGSEPELGPEQVSGYWALHASNRAGGDTGCRIALQKLGADGLYGVYLAHCDNTPLAKVKGWRVREGRVALVDAGDETVLSFRLTGVERLEAEQGGVTYHLEPAAVM